MNEPHSLTTLARSAWHDFRQAWLPLLSFQVLLKLVEAWLLVPGVAVLLAVLLSRAGHVAVSNWDALDFLFTPIGLVCAAILAIVAMALLLVELAGVMILAGSTATGGRPSLTQGLRVLVGSLPAIVKLGAIAVSVLTLVMVPFVLLAVLTHAVLLSEYDIYFYVKVRPLAFWLAASVGGLLLVVALAVLVWLIARWAFALPILLFEKLPPRAALRASRERGQGIRWRTGIVLVGWIIGVLLLGVVVEAGFRLVAASVLDRAGERPIGTILALLTVQGMLLAGFTFLLIVGLGLLTRRLYLQRSEQFGLLRPEEGEPDASGFGPLAWILLPAVLLVPLALWLNLSGSLADHPPVLITAHRGNARAAPENTLSAIRKAIESGADYAEVDVHQTADGVIVLLHDRDLRRVAGVSRRLDELTFEKVRQLDVGTWFDPAFAGERVPMLAEAIHLCRGRIKLNIELKLFGTDHRLAEAVARLVHEQAFESECLVTSFELDALRVARRHNPDLRIGLIIAHALGDVSRLEVDALSVRADFLTGGLLRTAHRQGREVHVWTVNEVRRMTGFMKRGVDNLITSDPDLAIRVRAEWASLTKAERLVLGSRLLLGLEP